MRQPRAPLCQMRVKSWTVVITGRRLTVSSSIEELRGGTRLSRRVRRSEKKDKMIYRRERLTAKILYELVAHEKTKRYAPSSTLFGKRSLRSSRACSSATRRTSTSTSANISIAASFTTSSYISTQKVAPKSEQSYLVAHPHRPSVLQRYAIPRDTSPVLASE